MSTERVVLTKHASERCAEMGVSPQIVRAIVMNPDVTRPGKRGSDCLIATNEAVPEYAVVFQPEQGDDPAIVVTVVFRTEEVYVRDGTTFRPKEKR